MSMVKKILFSLIMLWLSISQVKGQYSIAGVQGSIYIDIIPDTLLFPSPGQSPEDEVYYIDINQDKINDIKISTHLDYGLSHEDVYTTVESQNAFTGLSLTKPDSFYLSGVLYTKDILKKYYFGDTIKNANYSSGLTYLGYDYHPFPPSNPIFNNHNWQGSEDGFIGISYQSDIRTFYGWIKINVTNSATCTVKEYSLNSQSTNGIYLTPNKDIHVNIFPNPAINKLTIQWPLSQYTILFVYNAYGQEVYTETIQNKNSTEIDVSELAEGVYFVKVETNTGVLAKKKIILKN